MKRILFLIMATMSVCILNAQTDSIPQPNVNVNVNREYDEDGNLIRYDSVYTYSYSSDDFSQEEWDSMFYDSEDAYHRYNFDHFFNRPMPGFPYKFQFDFDDDYFDRFHADMDTIVDWEHIDSVFRRNLDQFYESMDNIFEQFYKEEDYTPSQKDTEEEKSGVDI